MTVQPEKLVLSSGQLTAELLPAWGSKMISLRTEPDGYDFLAPAPAGPRAPDASIYTPADAYGFDEMFPGVYPQPYPLDPWHAVQIADHGDLWYRPWSYSGGGQEATLWVEDARFPWYFSKTLRFTAPFTLETTYRAENRSDHPLFWLYSAHILCSYRAGVELELPDSRYQRLETFGQPLPEVCPADAAPLVRREAFPSDSAAFYMSDEVGATGCVYRDRRAGKALRLSWSEPIAYLGIWYNTGGWLDEMPLTHIGLEPTTAGRQDLAEWLRIGSPPPLNPGEQVSWQLIMAVEETGRT